jgi:hypothetical protein
MLVQLNLNSEEESIVSLVKKIGLINDINCNSKQASISLALKIANQCIAVLDEDSFKQVTGLNRKV